jgi:PEP-CTERM motif
MTCSIGFQADPPYSQSMRKFILVSLLLGSVSVQASTIQIASDLVNESNNLTSANVFIAPNPVWAVAPAGAGWISYADTGNDPEAFSPPNSTLNPWAIFTESFFLPGSTNTGSVRVWADDTASVTLDGSPVGPPADLILGSACAAGSIGCLPNAFADISLSGLSQGEHSLTFSVYQLGGGPFGLLYSGSVTSTDAQVAPAPEPATFLALGVGLLAFAAILRRRNGFK